MEGATGWPVRAGPHPCPAFVGRVASAHGSASVSKWEGQMLLHPHLCRSPVAAHSPLCDILGDMGSPFSSPSVFLLFSPSSKLVVIYSQGVCPHHSSPPICVEPCHQDPRKAGAASPCRILGDWLPSTRAQLRCPPSCWHRQVLHSVTLLQTLAAAPRSPYWKAGNTDVGAVASERLCRSAKEIRGAPAALMHNGGFMQRTATQLVHLPGDQVISTLQA